MPFPGVPAPTITPSAVPTSTPAPQKASASPTAKETTPKISDASVGVSRATPAPATGGDASAPTLGDESAVPAPPPVPAPQEESQLSGTTSRHLNALACIMMGVLCVGSLLHTATN